MTEFFQECIHPVNLPVTLLLVAMLAYWSLVIVGAVGMDAIDLDMDTDLDAGDFDTDLHGHGALANVLEFLYIGDVPVVIVASFFAISLWITTLLTNHYFNEQQSLLVMVTWFIPNVVISLLATKLALMPIASMFKNYDKPEFTRDDLIGSIGIVKTSEVTSDFGQIEIEQAGPTLVLNVRTKPDIRLRAGDAAKIISFNKTNDTFLVELSKWEKP